MFVLTSRDEFQESLEQDLVFGIFTEKEQIVALSLVITGRDCERNDGRYFDYTPEQLRKCVTYDTTFVHPDFRGYGFQRLFVELKDQESRKLGAEEAFSTISPDNEHSLNNVIARGFTIAAEKELFGGRRRYIMRKCLTSEV